MFMRAGPMDRVFDGVGCWVLDTYYWMLGVEGSAGGGLAVGRSASAVDVKEDEDEAHPLQEDDDPSPDRHQDRASLRREERVSRPTGTAPTSVGSARVFAGARRTRPPRPRPTSTTHVGGRRGRVAPASPAPAVVSGRARAATQSPRARRPGPRRPARRAARGVRRGECRRRRARRR